MAKSAKTEGLTGIRKAAILMIALDTETSSKIMQNLEVEEIERLSMEIARSEDDIPTDVREAVIREFYQLHMASKYACWAGTS